MSKYESYYERVKELNQKGMTNTEIAEELGIDTRRISDINSKLGLNKKMKTSKIELTEVEKDLIIGSIIGDGCIFKDKAAVNYRMNLSHSLKQREYFLKKYYLVKRLITSNPRIRSWVDKRTNKRYSEIKYQTMTNELFTELYNVWYKDGKKIIPRNKIKDINSTVLAIKYFDDGWYHRNSCYISMDHYDAESIENLRAAIKINFNIETNLHKKSIYIPSREFKRFVDIVKPFATSDVLYKLGEFGETLTK